MKFTTHEAVQKIVSNGGKVGGTVIDIEKPGLKILSAISFLVNHCGYVWSKHLSGKM